jgi:hypothetical protein
VIKVSIAVFGSKVFDVTQNKIHTFEDFQYGSSFETEKQEAIGKKPSTYDKGPGLNTIGFKIKLNVEHGINPRREIDEWENMKDSKIAHPFILGGRPLGGNKWRILNIQASEEIIDNKGNMLYAEITVSLEEYVRPGTAAKKTTAQNSSAPGFSLPPISGEVTMLSPSEKAYLKRKNEKLYEVG